MTQPGYDIDALYQEAQIRWLKPAEVLFILQNHDKYQLTHEPPQRPTGGSLFLFNKRVLRFFRRDGHNWRKKKDGRTVGEAHERLKVGNIEALNCYYAHGEDNPNFQRRSYWILDPAYEHIVLVHYREISEGKPTVGSIAQLSPGSSSTFSQSPSSYTTQNLGSVSIFSDLYEPFQTISSPESAEVSSDTVTRNNNGIKNLVADEYSQALRRLEEQLSLNDDSIKDVDPFIIQDGNPNGLGSLEFEREITGQEQYEALLHGSEYTVCDQFYSGHAIDQNDSSDLGLLLRQAGYNEKHYQSLEHEYPVESKESLPWKEMLESCKNSSGVGAQERYMMDQKMPLSSAKSESAEEKEYFQWSNLDGNNDGNSSLLLPQEVDNIKYSTYSPLIGAPEANPNYYSMLFDQVRIGMPFEADPSLTISHKQKYTIQEISPEWGYANEATKVIIIGSFLCDQSESAWTCMFGDIEVPVQIIQQGVIRCEAPPYSSGKVTLCITSGNRESCSEVREFEYRDKTGNCIHCNSMQTEDTKSPEELLLVVRLVQMLLSDPSMQNGGGTESGVHLLRKLNADNEAWDRVTEALLDGSVTSSATINWLLEELLKDKLQQWLSSRFSEAQDKSSCSLSKKEQGMIHMVAGLGFEWALNPILSHGVSINFRDINGWTALHWAARFGRERIVADLIASGASAGAVTDPTSQDPTGKTAASIAAVSGHKGIAGYLSEVALTSHLSSLTLEESELSKGSAEVEAEITVNSISEERLAVNEDQLSLKDTLAAVRNAAQAAARIQSAFRAHSFRRRQQREAAADVASIDDYSINPDDVRGISALSKMTFGSARDHHLAALSIQKKYRGWKGRKDYLSLRQKVVKIQAHVRGYQVRKNYKVICWAVGILDKVVLRWRRKGVGLRGFRHEIECIDESEDEDILKVFRKQKVDAAIDEAVSRVLSMVNSSEARQQYRRMLEKYRQAKAELNSTASSTSLSDPYFYSD